MSEPVAVPGGRDVRASLDRADGDGGACVVACPPDPREGGSRSDPRLRALADALVERGIDCLRIDYGPADGGPGERDDAVRAVGWARKRYRRVGLAGYSFGGAVALLAGVEAAPDAVSALLPVPELDGLDAVAALDALACPVQVVHGERDAVVDATPLVERARELGHRVDALDADHRLAGTRAAAVDRVTAFLAGALSGTA